jgi:uncharacterized Fe-S cluster-containing radical SAM superfamily protein
MYMKYSNGYIPKIEYWVNKLLNASTPIEQATALSKVRYFQNRHKEVYGEIVTMDGHGGNESPTEGCYRWSRLLRIHSPTKQPFQ